MFSSKEIFGDKKIGNELGRLGEDIACKFLEKNKFKIIDRNYKRKWGELDIVANEGPTIHFVEVKTVSCEMAISVTHETSDNYRAEDNIHPWKIKRLKRAIQTYLEDKSVSPETDWVFDVITVKLFKDLKVAKIFFIKELVI